MEAQKLAIKLSYFLLSISRCKFIGMDFSKRVADNNFFWYIFNVTSHRFDLVYKIMISSYDLGRVIITCEDLTKLDVTLKSSEDLLTLLKQLDIIK